MGWGTGSLVMNGVIKTIEKHVKDYDTKVKMYLELIDVFTDYDADTLDECSGSRAFKKAIKQYYGDDE
jgi:hypothetical protein